MICAVDIGNSSLKAGLFEAGDLKETFRISLEQGHAAAARGLVGRLHRAGVEALGISSVVPTACDAITDAMGQGGDVRVFILSHTSRLPFKLSYLTPETMGVDRIAAAAGAWHGFRAERERPIVVVDAGTAVTVDVIADGAFLGGPIAPGPELIRQAARLGTAQLPVVELKWPDRAISKSTREAVAAGIMLSFVDGIRGILVRIIDELDRQPSIVATGGWGSLINDKIALVGLHDADLVVRGVAYLMDLNSDA